MTAPTQRPLATIEDNGFPWQQDIAEHRRRLQRLLALGRRDRARWSTPTTAARRTSPRSTSSASTSHGKIVLVRYGKNFRGVKAHLAEEHGAVGRDHLLRSRGRRLRQGPGLSRTAPSARPTPSSAARSSTSGSTRATRSRPAGPSVPGTPRLQPDQAENLLAHPDDPDLLPRGRAAAARRSAAPWRPDDFQGGLRLPVPRRPGPDQRPHEARHRLRPGAAQRRLRRDPRARAPRPVRHARRATRTPGPSAPTTTSAAGPRCWRSASGLGALLRQGWRPDRTIVLAGWDGEEYGLLGSTEWTEQYERDAARATPSPTLNLDITAGQEFGAGAACRRSTTLIFDVTKTVPEPGHRRRRSTTSGSGDKPAPTIGRLGSGSDYTGPFDHVGVPSLEAGFTSPPAAAATTPPTTTPTNIEHFLDPGYLGTQAAAAKILGVTALRLANADVYPLHYSDYATAVQGYVDDLQQVQSSRRRRRAGRPDAAAPGRPGVGRGDERAGGARRGAAGAAATTATAARCARSTRR